MRLEFLFRFRKIDGDERQSVRMTIEFYPGIHFGSDIKEHRNFGSAEQNVSVEQRPLMRIVLYRQSFGRMLTSAHDVGRQSLDRFPHPLRRILPNLHFLSPFVVSCFVSVVSSSVGRRGIEPRLRSLPVGRSATHSPSGELCFVLSFLFFALRGTVSCPVRLSRLVFAWGALFSDRIVTPLHPST